MKKFLFVFLLSLSVLTLNQTASALGSDIKKEAGYISLSDSLTKEVEPDIATITFSIENTANTAQKAVADNNITSNNIVTALKLIVNSNTDTIKTSRYSVTPVYNTIAGKKVIRNYMAVNSLTVITKDIENVSKLIDTAIEKGANRTSDLQFGLENSKKMCNELYPQIIKDLKTQAETFAGAVGTSLDGLKHLNVSCNTDSSVSNPRIYANKAMDSISESTPIETGKTKIRVYVNADFFVK